MRFKAGATVRVEFSKWDGSSHWQYDAIYLGSDEHGDWCGVPTGTRIARPGADYTARVDGVTLAPADGKSWLASYNAEDHPLEIYIDLTTPPHWDGTVLRAVDMDLDVVATRTGREPYIDDEDEFAEHTIAYGYPDDVVALTETTAKELLRAVVDRRAPFDGTADRWIAELTKITN